MEEYLNVVNALRSSERLKHWDKPPLDYGPDNPEDSDYNRNGLKDVGDLGKIDFSRQYSFGSKTEINEECQPSENKDEKSADFPHQSFYSVKAISEPGHLCRPSALEIARKAHEQYKLNLLLERLSLEKKYKRAIQRKTQQKQEAYMQCLSKIHALHEEEAEKYHLIQKEKLRHEENRLRQQQEEAHLAVQLCKKDYTSQVSKHSSQLLEAVESARRQEAEHANLLVSLIAQLQTANADFITKLNLMYQIINELEGSETVSKNMEAYLNQTRSQVESLVINSRQRPTTRMQIDEVQKALQQGLAIVESIIQKLEAKKLEKTNLEAERIHQENEKAKAKAAELEKERQEALRKQESIESDQKIEENHYVVSEADNRDRLMNLKQKMSPFLEAHEKLSKEQLWDVRRKATVANQLNKDNHNINRDKLQKLLNEMRERKAEPEMLACFKNSVTSNIVKQVAIQDALGASAYSWLLVELITFHPDLWDLFLYYLFKACPILMPGSQVSEESLKNIEKPDVFYSQVSKYSTMYGFVLTRFSKKQGSPIKAAAVGWEIFANIVSQPPVSGITGELLLKFLDSFGYVLQQTYKKQFVKLMEFIGKSYLPKVKEATEGGGQNCLTLLENLMTEYRRNKLVQNSMIIKYM